MALGLTVTVRDAFSARARNIGRGFTNLDDIAYRSARGISRSADLIQAEVYRIAQTFAAGFAVLGTLVFPTKRAMEFGEAMAQVATIADYTRTNMEALRKEVLRQAYLYPTSPMEQAEGLYRTISSGFIDTAEATTILDEATRLGVTSLTSTTQTLRALTGVLNAYGGSAEDAWLYSARLFETMRYGRIKMDELGKYVGYGASAAGMAGINVDDMLASVAAMTLGSLSPEQAFQYYRQLVIGTVKPTAQAERVARKYNIPLGRNALVGQFQGDWSAWLKHAYDVVAVQHDNLEDFARLLSGRQAFAGAATLLNMWDKFSAAREGIASPWVLDEFGVVITSQERAFRIIERQLSYQVTQFRGAVTGIITSLGTASEQFFVPIFRAINRVAGSIQVLVERYPQIQQFFLGATLAATASLMVFGALQVSLLRQSAAWAKLREQAKLTQFRFFGMNLTAGQTVRTISGMFLLLTLGFWGVRKAFEQNWMGIEDRWRKVRAVANAFTQMERDGQFYYLPTPIWEQLKEMGLDDFVVRLTMLRYRVATFLTGLRVGATEFIQGFASAVGSAIDRFVNTVARVSEPLANRMRAFFDTFRMRPEDVAEWAEMGRAVGRATGAVAVFVTGLLTARSVVAGMRALGFLLLAPFRMLKALLLDIPRNLLGGLIERARALRSRILKDRAQSAGVDWAGMAAAEAASSRDTLLNARTLNARIQNANLTVMRAVETAVTPVGSAGRRKGLRHRVGPVMTVPVPQRERGRLSRMGSAVAQRSRGIAEGIARAGRGASGSARALSRRLMTGLDTLLLMGTVGGTFAGKRLRSGWGRARSFSLMEYLAGTPDSEWTRYNRRTGMFERGHWGRGRREGVFMRQREISPRDAGLISRIGGIYIPSTVDWTRERGRRAREQTRGAVRGAGRGMRGLGLAALSFLNPANLAKRFKAIPWGKILNPMNLVRAFAQIKWNQVLWVPLRTALASIGKQLTVWGTRLASLLLGPVGVTVAAISTLLGVGLFGSIKAQFGSVGAYMAERMPTWYRLFQRLGWFVSDIWEGIKSSTLSVISAIGDGLRSLGSGIGSFFSNLWSGIQRNMLDPMGQKLHEWAAQDGVVGTLSKMAIELGNLFRDGTGLKTEADRQALEDWKKREDRFLHNRRITEEEFAKVVRPLPHVDIEGLPVSQYGDALRANLYAGRVGRRERSWMSSWMAKALWETGSPVPVDPTNLPDLDKLHTAQLKELQPALRKWLEDDDVRAAMRDGRTGAWGRHTYQTLADFAEAINERLEKEQAALEGIQIDEEPPIDYDRMGRTTEDAVEAGVVRGMERVQAAATSVYDTEEYRALWKEQVQNPFEQYYREYSEALARDEATELLTEPEDRREFRRLLSPPPRDTEGAVERGHRGGEENLRSLIGQVSRVVEEARRVVEAAGTQAPVFLDGHQVGKVIRKQNSIHGEDHGARVMRVGNPAA